MRMRKREQHRNLLLWCRPHPSLSSYSNSPLMGTFSLRSNVESITRPWQRADITSRFARGSVACWAGLSKCMALAPLTWARDSIFMAPRPWQPCLCMWHNNSDQSWVMSHESSEPYAHRFVLLGTYTCGNVSKFSLRYLYRVSDQSSDTVEIRMPLLGKRKMLSTSILRQYVHPPARCFDPAAELAAWQGVVLPIVPPSCSPVFQYKSSHFSVFCMHYFQYFTKNSVYDICTKFSRFSVLLLKFYQYLWSEFSKNKILINPYTWRHCTD